MNIDDIFGIEKVLDKTKLICNSGGAIGSDFFFSRNFVQKKALKLMPSLT